VLFVDGVLVDEEWPHGALHGFQGPFLVGAAWSGMSAVTRARSAIKSGCGGGAGIAGQW
jgi:hypothetical protein